jgi:hypothetical protein
MTPHSENRKVRSVPFLKKPSALTERRQPSDTTQKKPRRARCARFRARSIPSAECIISVKPLFSARERLRSVRALGPPYPLALASALGRTLGGFCAPPFDEAAWLHPECQPLYRKRPSKKPRRWRENGRRKEPCSIAMIPMLL